jgi:hypothetical protein
MMADTSTLESFSVYRPMRDGVRIAVQVLGALGFRARRSPVIVVFTRYGRATFDAIAEAPFSESMEFTRLGFVVLSVDVRGTGASFGCRPRGRSADELADCGEIFDWAAAEPWSDGRLFCTGVSYGGNVADLVQVLDHPSLVAVAPRFTDYDLYEHLLFPGGAPNELFTRVWGELTAALDRGDSATEDPAAERRTRARWVDGDNDGDIYRQALADHAGNTDFGVLMASVAFREDLQNGANLCDLGERLAAGARPAYHWASWMDAGTAAGALARFATLSGPMRVKIGLWNHGAIGHADPFEPARLLSEAERRADVADIAEFFLDPDATVRRIEYRTAGQPGWHSTAIWPPEGHSPATWWLDAEGRLDDRAPQTGGVDRHDVDFSAGTGASTRWTTQVGTLVQYPDRREADRLLATYDSEPLVNGIEITGTPSLALWLRSSRDDGLLIAYLERVAPDGAVTYLTEGELRFLHRAVSATSPGYVREGPNRSFARSEGQLLRPAEIVALQLPLLPLSVRLERGDRLRLALAGADADTFARVPGAGPAVLEILRGAATPSHLVLPVRGLA